MEITRKLFKSESGANFLLLHLPLNKQTLAKSTPGLQGSTGETLHIAALAVREGHTEARLW